MNRHFWVAQLHYFTLLLRECVNRALARKIMRKQPFSARDSRIKCN